jgi:hypothetical protein
MLLDNQRISRIKALYPGAYPFQQGLPRRERMLRINPYVRRCGKEMMEIRRDARPRPIP